jgi:hypothetical protein
MRSTINRLRARNQKLAACSRSGASCDSAGKSAPSAASAGAKARKLWMEGGDGQQCGERQSSDVRARRPSRQRFIEW